MPEEIGFVGPGVMGSSMVRALLADGHRVSVWARTPAKARFLEKHGARVRERLPQLAEECRHVVGCLRDGNAVREIYLGPDGLASAAHEGQVFVEHGTFGPALAREIGAALSPRGASFLDAPVTGGPEGARAGTLVTMVGGDHQALRQVADILLAYSSRIQHIGEQGAGLELKLVNQLLVSVHLAAAAEGAALLQRLGIDIDLVQPVLNGGWAASAMLARSLPRVAAHDFANDGASISGLVEVQQVISQVMVASGMRTVLMPVVVGLFETAVNSGLGHSDPAALVTLFDGDAVDGQGPGPRG